MKIAAAGAGPPEGLPVPGCSCAACRLHRRRGTVSRPAQLLVDGAEVSDQTVWTGPGVLWIPDAGATGQLGPLAPGSIQLALIGPGPDGDLTRVARLLAVLRRQQVLTGGAECVLIAATHESAPAGRRALLLTAWGMTEASDGQEWTLPHRRAHDPGSERVLVIGGSGSGKSALAEDLVAAHPSVVYLATGPAADPARDAEWAQRVERHQQRRPGNWTTVETSDPAAALARSAEPVLLDSLGSWLTGALDRAGAWTGAPGWRTRVDDEISDLTSAWRAREAPAVAVTDEVGWGVVPETPAGRLFRDLLGQVNQAVAQQSDRVLVVVAGQVLARAGDGP